MTNLEGMQQVEAYIKMGRLDEAIQICKIAIQKQPNQAYAYQLLGIAMQLKGEFKEAETYYKKALLIQPNQSEIYANLGNLYIKVKHWQDAIAAYQKAIKINPDNVLFYQALAQIFAQINQTEAATDCWYQVLVRQPERIKPEEQFQLGNTLLDQGKIDQAIICYRYAIQYNPNFYHPYCQLGLALSQKEQFLEAISAYKKSIELNPNFSWSYQGLGENFSKLEQWEDGILAYQKAIELNPNFSWSYQGLGENFSKLERWEDAILAYEKAIELNPNFSWSYYGLGEAYRQFQQWEKAAATYRYFLTLHPNTIEAYFNLGLVLKALNQWEEAHIAFNQCLQLNPNYPDLPLNLVEVFSNLGNWEEAIKTYQNCWDGAFELEILYQKLGEFLQQQGNIQQAIACYQHYLKIHPHGNFYLIVADLLINQQQWEEAIPFLLQELKRHPDDFDHYIKLGLLLEKMGRKLDGDGCRYLQVIPHDILKKYIGFSEDLITSISEQPNLQKIPLYPESLVNFVPPNGILGEANLELFPNGMLSSEAFIAVIPNGRAWGDRLTSAVITSEHQLIKELSTGCAELIVSHDQLPPPLELSGNVAFLSAQFGLIYYHWMFDLIARLHLLEKASFDWNKIDYFVVNRHQSRYEQETLKLLNIPDHKIIDNCVYPHIKAPVLLVPSPIKWNHLKASKWGVDFIRNNLLSTAIQSQNYPQRIYISRKNAFSRQVINEIEFLPFLEDLGFQVLYLENLSFQEQISYFVNAEIVIAPHGSGLTNLMFCRPYTKVIEFLCPRWTASCYWQLCNIVNCEYYCCVAESADEGELNLSANYDNIKVSLDSIIQLMKLAHIIE